MFHDRGSLHLADESLAEHAPDRTPGVIGPQAEEKSGLCAEALEKIREPWRAFARATFSVDVDLERNVRHRERYARFTGWRAIRADHSGRSMRPVTRAASRISSTSP